MALANVAALLARWGHRVLALDWDLEAPGLERYFVGENGRSPEVDPQRPGMLELLLSVSDEDRRPWRECVQSIETEPNVEPISLISAGRRDQNYNQRLQSINFERMFEKQSLGKYIDQLRSSGSKTSISF